MRVFIAGVDGYLGWSLAQYLAARGHQVAGADLLLRRRWVEEMGSWSAIPIGDTKTRLEAFRSRYGSDLKFWHGDLRDYAFVERIFRDFKPEAVVHLGECPSAPYSMMDVNHTVFVQTNNIVSTFNLIYAIRDTCPDAQLVKLGTMGEYGTPNVDIPEGFFDIEYRGRNDRMVFPRAAGSWYHWSKVHGSMNVMFACKLFALRATDIMQGVVFGTRIDEMGDDAGLFTRLDFDQAFGTSINRFCCMAVIGHPLTLFGKGGQRRGFLPLRDSMQCLTLTIENPPQTGEYRVFNQFQEVYRISELAERVQAVAKESGLSVEIQHVENPRMELEEHHYNPEHAHLFELGYKPAHTLEDELRIMIPDLTACRDRIIEKQSVLIPDVRWDGTRRRSELAQTAYA